MTGSDGCSSGHATQQTIRVSRDHIFARGRFTFPRARRRGLRCKQVDSSKQSETSNQKNCTRNAIIHWSGYYDSSKVNTQLKLEAHLQKCFNSKVQPSLYTNITFSDLATPAKPLICTSRNTCRKNLSWPPGGPGLTWSSTSVANEARATRLRSTVVLSAAVRCTELCRFGSHLFA